VETLILISPKLSVYITTSRYYQARIPVVLAIAMRGFEMLITNPPRAKQIVDFSGLRDTQSVRGATDVDIFMEYDDKLFILGEVKLRDAPLSYGQQLALERIVRAISAGDNKIAVASVASHETDDTNVPIDAAKAVITKAYYKKSGEDRPRWRVPRRSGRLCLVGELVEILTQAFIEKPVVLGYH
jgi:hypothetical protein